MGRKLHKWGTMHQKDLKLYPVIIRYVTSEDEVVREGPLMAFPAGGQIHVGRHTIILVGIWVW